jgi:hypothetical protein
MTTRRIMILLAGATVAAAALNRVPRARQEGAVRPAVLPPVPAPEPLMHDTPLPARRRSKGRFARRALLTLAILGAAGTAAGMGSYSAFTATTSNTGNGFTTGSVTLTDNDSGAAMLGLANAKPLDADTSCIQIKYTGTLGAGVHLYGAISGTLGQYLTLTVTRGTDSAIPQPPTFDTCANFTADATDYGNGPGVVYTGNLSGFPATWAAGIVDPTASWAQNEVHSYKFTVTVQDNNSAQGLTATAGFTWEARNA